METDFKELVLQLYKKSEADGNIFKRNLLKPIFFNAKLKQKAAFCHFSQSEWAQMQELKSLLKTQMKTSSSKKINQSAQMAK